MEEKYYGIVFKSPRRKYNFELKRNVIDFITKKINGRSNDFLKEFRNIIGCGGVRYDVFLDPKKAEPLQLPDTTVADICKELECTYEELIRIEQVGGYETKSKTIDFDMYKDKTEKEERKKVFADRMKQRYQSFGIQTANDFAKEAGISQSLVNAILRCKQERLSAMMVKRITSRLFCTRDYLLGETLNPRVNGNPDNDKLLEYGTLIFIEDDDSKRQRFINYVRMRMNIKGLSDKKMQTLLKLDKKTYNEYFDSERHKVVIPKKTVDKICETLGENIETLVEAIEITLPLKDPAKDLRPLYSKMDFPLLPWMFVEYDAGHITREVEDVLKLVVKRCSERSGNTGKIKEFLNLISQ